MPADYLHVVTVYSFCAGLTLYHCQYSLIVNSNPFSPYLTIALPCYVFLLYLNYSDKNFQKQREIQSAKLINSLSILMTFNAFLLHYAYDGILLKYVTWCFTFPVLLKMDGHTHPSTLKMSYILSESTFAFNLLNYLHGHVVWDVLQYACSVAFFVHYVVMTNRVKLTKSSYIPSVWVMYAVLHTMYRVNVLTMDVLYIGYIVLDLGVKCLVTLLYQHQFIMQIPNTLGVIKAVRLIMPGLDNALMDHVVNDSEYNEIVNALTVRHTQDSLIKELYPNDAWKHILSPFNKHVMHHGMTILFCDLVNYSTYCMEHSIDEIIQYVHRYYCEMDSIISKHRVHKVETIGDAYLIVHTDVLDVLECAENIVRHFKDSVRVGIHYGTIASCTLGITKIRHAFVGHAINMAARLESSGCPGKIHVSEDVVHAYECHSKKKSFEFMPMPAVHLKGMGDHVTYFANIV